MNDLLSFENKKERNDFLIALVVIAFFGWLFFYFGVFGKKQESPLKEPMATASFVTSSNTASPDQDGDGIADNKDVCPELAGIMSLNGCPPDTDGDGVYDPLDKCPDVKGDVDGCPKRLVLEEEKEEIILDRDEDGIPNAKDACPELAGVLANNGCPADADGDGIYDVDDKCPETKGIALNDGCPTDADGDGIYDVDDKCPEMKGSALNNGCPPDADGDGVYDGDDNCPETKGIAANNGCPADTDGDGVYDTDDNCPNKAGLLANRGCPEVVLNEAQKATISKAINGVKFLPNLSRLMEYSAGNLKGVYELLKENPSYKLEISGHTDSIGNDADNLQLSKDRAKACKDLLIKMGIDSSRLSAEGYGETKPIGDNKTKAGRLKNRRVEFKLRY